MPIYFHSEAPLEFSLENEGAIANWLSIVATREGRTVEQLNVVFCDDEYLLKVNREHLNHDFYTDIITFDLSEDEQISGSDSGATITGDLFVSIDRVKENAKELSVEFDQEIKRVVVHGLLHLLGYSDKTDEEKAEMRGKEEACLELYDANA